MVRVKVNRAYTSSFLLFASTSILLRILDFGNWGSRVKKTGWMKKLSDGEAVARQRSTVLGCLINPILQHPI